MRLRRHVDAAHGARWDTVVVECGKRIEQGRGVSNRHGVSETADNHRSKVRPHQAALHWVSRHQELQKVGGGVKDQRRVRPDRA